jgi:hypothetical protein
MADQNERTFTTSEAQANRARMQGLGSGQREMDAGRDPNRSQHATNPERRSFDGDLKGATNADRPGQAEFGEQGTAKRKPSKKKLSPEAARLADGAGDLGVGTPPNVDVHKLGQEDRPQEDWDEPAAEGATFSSNHTRRAIRTETNRGQGSKTRTANKDIVSRRS